MHEDLVLMTRVAALLGSVEDDVLRDNERLVESGFKAILGEYYRSTEYYDQVEDLIDKMLKNNIWCFVLPPMAPFVKEYYNALKGARELIRQAA